MTPKRFCLGGLNLPIITILEIKIEKSFKTQDIEVHISINLKGMTSHIMQPLENSAVYS